MKWISSAEIFNIASSVPFLVLKKQILVLLGFKEPYLLSILASCASPRGKLNFNNQLLPLRFIWLSWTSALK